MSMVCGLDLHRGQITFDALEVSTGEVWRGRVWQPDRHGSAAGCATSWPPGPTASRWRWRWRAARGGGMWSRRSRPPASRRIWPSRPTPRRRGAANVTPRPTAPTPGCCGSCWPTGDLPESWIPPDGGVGVAGTGPVVQVAARSAHLWIQRIHAELLPARRGRARGAPSAPRGPERRWPTAALALSPAARQRIAAGFTMIDATDAELVPLRAELVRFGRRQPACRALMRDHFGIGGLTAVAVWSELGDCQRFTRSAQVVRHTGLDVTRRLLGPSPRRRVPRPPRPRDAALGALRGGQMLVSPHQPRPRLLRRRSRTVSTANWPPSPWPANWPCAATTRCGPSTPTQVYAIP